MMTKFDRHKRRALILRDIHKQLLACVHNRFELLGVITSRSCDQLESQQTWKRQLKTGT
jgi:hypothetical protein